MSEITIQLCTVTDIFSASTIDTLVAAYSQESAIQGMPAPRPNIDLYLAMESAGLLTFFGAYTDDDVLVGVLALTVSPVPQYGVDMGSIILFYVDEKHRKHGTGTRLVEHAERVAREKGALVLLMGAPTQGRLAKAAPMMGFKASHISFSKVLS
jgi:GNAT superfamily N-acetyltransferase